jgi:hypothetical protein
MTRAGMKRDIPAGSLDKSIRYHKTDNLPLWAAGDIDFSSIDWAKKAFIFAEADEDRADDAAAHQTV